MTAKALGEFLRARREQLRPEDVGLAWSGRRRVPGLRREEIAMLAGVSSDYYLRLEQGRDIRPSAQVLDALARALQLDEQAAAHLHVLSRSRPTPLRAGGRERVPAHIERLISTWSHTPAFVHDQWMEVLANNALIAAINPVFRPGANLIRATFLDEYTRQRLEDWETVARRAVARLRAIAGADIQSPPLVELVDELSARSPEFGQLWARHDVEVNEPQRYVLDHPLVGRLELFPVRLAVIGVDALFLIAHHTESRSPAARALTRLAAIVAGEDCPPAS